MTEDSRSDPSKVSEANVRCWEVTIRNRQGVHMRPAGILPKLAQTFDCDIQLEYDGHRMDAKSATLTLLTLAIPKGAVLRFEARGSDAAEAERQLTDLVENFFGLTEND